MMIQVLEALEASKKKHDTRINEIAQLEMDFIDDKLEAFKRKSDRWYQEQLADLKTQKLGNIPMTEISIGGVSFIIAKNSIPSQHGTE